MGLPVVTVAAGGLPIVEATLGTPVTEAANGRGVPVTKVVGKPGMPVVFETIGVAAPVTYATLDGVKSAQVVLSNGNLTATLNPSTNNVGARSATVKTTGKYYFEITAGPMHGAGCGMLTAAGTYVDMINSGTNCLMASSGTGIIYSNGTNSGFTVGGSYVSGDIICFAVDLGTRHAWARKNGGIWNNNAPANPATDTAGVTLYAAVGFSPAVGFGGGSQQTGDAFTANLGATAFAQAVPAGFTAGWPA